jgi:hypothetical protein
VGHFCSESGSGYGSTDLIESGSETRTVPIKLISNKLNLSITVSVEADPTAAFHLPGFTEESSKSYAVVKQSNSETVRHWSIRK